MPALPDEKGRQALRRVREGLDDLPRDTAATSWVWAALDLLLQTPPSGAIPASLPEYWETRQWLQQSYPELSSVRTIQRIIPARSSSVETFRIATLE